MILLFKLILITFICVMGAKIAMSEGMIFEKLGKYFEKKVADGYWWYDAFICPWCMASVTSLVAHFFAFGMGVLPMEINWQLFIRWPLVIMGSSFLCGNAWNIYETINRVKEKNETQEKYLSNVEKLTYFEIIERKKEYKKKFQSEQ